MIAANISMLPNSANNFYFIFTNECNSFQYLVFNFFTRFIAFYKVTFKVHQIHLILLKSSFYFIVTFTKII